MTSAPQLLAPAEPSPAVVERPVHRVVVADDDALLRGLLCELLAAAPSFEVVGDLADGHDLEAEVERTGATLVLVDVRMPGGGPDVVRRLVALSRPPVVVAVSASVDVPTVSGMLRAGCSGYLAKGGLGRSLVDDVQRCGSGQVVLAVPSAASVMRMLVWSGDAPGAGLGAGTATGRATGF